MAVVLLFLGLISVGLYLPSLRYDFVWNDRHLIVGNRLLLTSSPKDILTRSFWAGAGLEEVDAPLNLYYRPFTTISYWLDLKISGGRPWFFHLVNVLLGAFATIGVTLIVWELLHSGVWAGLAGLLFATHPAHTECIAYISSRADLLVTTFLSFGAFALLRSIRKRNWLWLLLLPFSYAMGLFSKESALLFPILIFITPFLTQTRPPKRFWWLLPGLLIVVITYLWARAIIFNQALPTPTALGTVKITNIVNTFGYYIRMFLSPFAHRVKIPPDPKFSGVASVTIYTVIFLVSFPLAAMRPRFWIALWGYAWAILFLLPVSNIFPLGLQAAERWLFLPSVGLIAIVITIFSRMLVAHHRLRAVVGVALIVIAGLFARDVTRRLPIWQNDLTLYSAMVKEARREPEGYAGLARAIQTTLPDSAIKLYNRAILLNQGFTDAHINIALLYTQKGDHRRAIHHLRLADELKPCSPKIQTYLAYAFLTAGQLDSAESAFNRAIALDSSFPRALLGNQLPPFVIPSPASGRVKESP